MTKIELKKSRGVLEAQQAELADVLRNRDALTIETSPDELDRIQHATERELAIGKMERESILLRSVRAALGRMDAGTFGVCLECEEDISPKRLAAVPWSPLCIVCQEAYDRERKEHGAESEIRLVDAA